MTVALKRCLFYFQKTQHILLRCLFRYIQFCLTNYIFLAVPPLSASLVIDRKRHLVAGKESNIECKCQGSRPAPLFRWFVGTKELDTSEKIAVEHHESGEWSSSIIKYVPKAEENGKTLVCKVTNEYFPDTVLEDSHVMNVQCKFVFHDNNYQTVNSFV